MTETASTTADDSQRFSRAALLAMLAGAAIISITMGLRQAMGVFQVPLTADLDFGREGFAFAMAIQNLLWGLAQPFAGMLADRFGAGRTLVLGGLVYTVGLIIMANAEGVGAVTFGGGVLIGFGLSGTSFAVVLGSVARLVSEQNRSMALGIATAGGSFGQFLFAPLSQTFIDAWGWQNALLVMAGIAALMALMAHPLRGRAEGASTRAGGSCATGPVTIRGATGEAFRTRGYWLLLLGFFVCGFQVSFISVHFPAYITDAGMLASVGAMALGLIGLFNIVGTYVCGALGGRYSKKYLLSVLYFLRSIVFLWFLAAPKTETNVYIFASVLGLLWLGTVPLTSGLVAQIFGPRFMSTLFGFVFFSHQIGSFLGVWLGGYLYDRTGSYDPVWIAGIVFGVMAAVIHLPIREGALRPAPA